MDPKTYTLMKTLLVCRARTRKTFFWKTKQKAKASAGHFRKPVRKSANPQIADLRFWFADLLTDFLPQTFADLR